MLDRPTPSRTRSLSRRWRVPAHYLHGAERFEGASILEECPGPLGLLLWQCERDVRLWATTSSSQREGIFVAGAGERCRTAMRTMGAVAKPLEAPIGVLVGMLEHPLDVSPEAVMLACRRVSQWSEARGAMATALTFAQASALSQPGSAPSAYQVGRLARRAGQAARAEGWLNRAIVLARQARDWETYAAAYSGLGNVNLTRGNLPAAERCQMKALRIATQHELTASAGGFLHDLFVIAAERGEPDRAIGFAEEAFRCYPAASVRRAALAHDVALLWMDQGQFRCAMPVLRSAWHRLQPDQQVIGLANIARAAGALQEAENFDHFSALAVEKISHSGGRDPHPAALLNIARGAASLNRWDQATYFAARALQQATEQSQHKVVFEVEAFTEALGSDQKITTEPSSDTDSSAELFAAEITIALEAVSPVPVEVG